METDLSGQRGAHTQQLNHQETKTQKFSTVAILLPQQHWSVNVNPLVPDVH